MHHSLSYKLISRCLINKSFELLRLRIEAKNTLNPRFFFEILEAGVASLLETGYFYLLLINNPKAQILYDDSCFFDVIPTYCRQMYQNMKVVNLILLLYTRQLSTADYYSVGLFLCVAGFIPVCSLGVCQAGRMNFGKDVSTLKYFTICGLQEGYEPFAVNMNRDVTMWLSKRLPQFVPVPPNHQHIEVRVGPWMLCITHQHIISKETSRVD